MRNKKFTSIIYVTEYENQFHVWQTLHAFRSRERALESAGSSGRLIETVPLADCQAILNEVNCKIAFAIGALKGIQCQLEDEALKERIDLILSKLESK